MTPKNISATAEIRMR